MKADQKITVLEDWIDVSDFRDRPDFKKFVREVETALKAAKEPLKVSQLLKLVGRPEWLLDALETSTSVRKIPGYLDRYFFTTAVKIKPPGRQMLRMYNVRYEDRTGASK